MLSYFAYADANYQKLIANYHKLYVKSKKIIFEKFTSIFGNYTLSEAPNELGVIALQAMLLSPSLIQMHQLR